MEYFKQKVMSMTDNMQTILNVDMVSILMLMEINIRVCLKMICLMERELIFMLLVNKKRVTGLMGSFRGRGREMI